jgi:hypothetical protein
MEEDSRSTRSVTSMSFLLTSCNSTNNRALSATLTADFPLSVVISPASCLWRDA